MKSLKLSTDDRVLGGVIGGFAEYTGLSSSLLRILFVLCVVLGIGTPIFLYIIVWILMLLLCKDK
jgi:phage shock protein PspC (stress-responsive transcriptional regulator)